METNNKNKISKGGLFGKIFSLISNTLLVLIILITIVANFYQRPEHLFNPIFFGIMLLFIILTALYLKTGNNGFKRVISVFFTLSIVVSCAILGVSIIRLYLLSIDSYITLGSNHWGESVTFITISVSFSMYLKELQLICNKQLGTSLFQKTSLIIMILLSFAGFTRAGVFPNFTNLPFLNSGTSRGAVHALKPVIYLYPEKEQEIRVKLDYQGEIIADYPTYDESIKGWTVIGHPDGKVIDHQDGKEYSYIFWEGESYGEINWDLSTGFVVKGADTKEFLQEKLSMMGLTPKEYNEFIVYWYPRMKDNTYNLIHFAKDKYINHAPLSTIPEADSTLRVFMVYKPLSSFVDIEEQEIIPFERKGFTLVEWGGAMVDK